jgi:hypothetical protein
MEKNENLSSSIADSISSNLNNINNNYGYGNISTTLGTGGYYYPASNPNIRTTTGYVSTLDDATISISDALKDALEHTRKEKEILDDIEKFCNEKCFFKLEDICDSELKCDCPLWNRLKCEKRV